ncbi:hypothetical protein COCCU_10105 [Corynebacterium occultum]|uniref:PPE family protein n=1 Tax=Corynebacterium occultum TaxID=2675219 RepID=A0A6B8WD72_9CORY|nr:hypothetical protein [Corynebacterium occultum]QGU07940.1 hypothetical protein COCCU_10105 [Corynebacterium occultum]
MEITIDTGSIESSIAELEQLGDVAMNAASTAHQSTLNGSFSGVSGLDQLGSGHGAVITGGPGSAVDVLNSYAEQIQWLGEALKASYTALTGQNTYVGRGMDIADEGGAVGADGVSFPQRPMPRFENFSFTPPVVTPAMSIDQLAAEFSATNIGAAITAAATWKQLSTSVAQVAAGLHGVAGRLAAENSGDVITAAAEKISAVAAAGDTFAANSAVMTTSVQQLAAIKSQGAVQVNMARSALAAIVEPVEKMAAERAFLVAFPASFSPSVVTGVPPIRNLMSMDGGTGGGGEIALGMDSVAGDGPVQSTGLNPAGAAASTSAAFESVGGGSQFSTVESGLSQLSRVGHNASELNSFGAADELGTFSAGLGSPLASPMSNLGGIPGAAPGAGSQGAFPGINAALGMSPLGSPKFGAAVSTPGTGSVGGLRGGASNPGGINPSAALRGNFSPLPAPNFTSPTLPGGNPGSGRIPGVLPATGLPTTALPGGGSGPSFNTLSGGAPGISGVSGTPTGGMGAPMMGGMGAPGQNGAQNNPLTRPGVGGVSGNSRLTSGGLNGPGGTGGAPRLSHSAAPGSVAGPGGAGAGARPALPGSGAVSGDPHQARGLSGTGAGSGMGSAHANGNVSPGSNAGAHAGGTQQGARGAGSATGRGMMPMMGSQMGGAQGNQGKPSKVRTVTSAVEEEGNIADLLGERSPVVPGVIGAWVRN